MTKKIWFINPEDTFLENKGDRLPLGLLYLSSYCKSLGADTKIIDCNHELLSYSKLMAGKPHYLCFGIATPNYKTAINMAKDIKAYRTKYPRLFNHYLKLIAGGNHITAMPNEKDTIETFDYIIIGEGEKGLEMLLSQHNTNQLIHSPPIEDLDTLPYPDYDGVDMSKYKMTLEGKPAILIIGSRGCVYSCMFCGSAKLKKWRGRSALNIVTEMIILYDKYGKKGFYFGDDIYSFDRNRTIEIAKEIIKNKQLKLLPEDLILRITTRTNLMDEEQLIWLKQAGLDIISFGLESGSDRILATIQKQLTVKHQKDKVELCHKLGIKIKGFFIMGLPEEKEEDLQLTIDFAKSLNLEYADCYLFTPFPSAPVWDTPEKWDLKLDKDNKGDWNNYFQIGKDGMPAEWKVQHPNLSFEIVKKYIEKFKQEVTNRGLTY